MNNIKKSTEVRTPQEALAILRDGNLRFMNNLRANRNYLEQISETKHGQFPFGIILSCMDSRTSAELIFDLGLGDIFSARIAGNVLNEDILGSMEYACKVAGSKVIVVLGHTGCGAVKGAVDQAELGHLTQLVAKINPAIEKVKCSCGDAAPTEMVNLVAAENVRLVSDLITEKSPILREMLENGEIGIIGGMYDIQTGRVEFFDDEESMFRHMKVEIAKA